MKKFIVMALLVAVSAGAFASSLAIPWFFDNSTEYPPTGNAQTAFIALKNNTDDALVCQIVYYSAAGDAQEAVNTFEIATQASIAFTPKSTLGAEGPGADVGSADTESGSATVKWVGDLTDVQGRIMQVGSNGNMGMYLLPSGI